MGVRGPRLDAKSRAEDIPLCTAAHEASILGPSLRENNYDSPVCLVHIIVAQVFKVSVTASSLGSRI